MPDEKASPKRRYPYAVRPAGERLFPGPFPYEVRCKNTSVNSDWEVMCSQIPNNARRCFDHMATDPQSKPTNANRVTALAGAYEGLYEYEVSGGGRVFYQVNVVEHQVIIVLASMGHPKGTEPQ